MEGKVLLFVHDYQLKRTVINAIAEMDVPFVEVVEQEELSFKMQLIHDEQKLYIHEYIFKDEEQFVKMKDMQDKGFKTLVIFPKYSIEYIDKCTEYGISDLLVLPLKEQALKSKITTLLKLPVKEIIEETVPEKTSGIKDIIELEVNRAQRGHYDLSFVMIDLSIIPARNQIGFIEKLQKLLRETDVVLKTDEKGIYLTICPFTKKSYLVEVENKIRGLFEDQKKKAVFFTSNKLYIYGLTLGEDGDDFNTLHEKLVENIKNSKILDQAFSKRTSFGSDKFKAYQKLIKRY